MCTVSMVGDHFTDKWNKPEYQKFQLADLTTVTRAEFEALKKEVEDMKALLIRAKIYDEKNNEPNCELDEKIATLKKMAEIVGIDLDEIFTKK